MTNFNICEAGTYMSRIKKLNGNIIETDMKIVNENGIDDIGNLNL